jgi:hypothetical protein
LRASAQWLKYPSPGTPRFADGKPNLSAPAPRLPDGKPDLSGIWTVECGVCGRDSCFTKEPVLRRAAGVKAGGADAAVCGGQLAQRKSREHVDDPYGYSMPPAVPRID